MRDCVERERGRKEKGVGKRKGDNQTGEKEHCSFLITKAASQPFSPHQAPKYQAPKRKMTTPPHITTAT